MKNLLTSITGLCLLVTTFSQTYHPFPTDSVSWMEYRVSGFGGCDYQFYDYIYPSGQATIGAHTYTRLLCDENFVSLDANPCSPTTFYSGVLYGFIRNDSINKKVYWYDSIYTHQEILLYDFNLVIGDTVSPLPGTLEEDTDTVLVVDIDSVDIGGAFRKSFALESTTGSGFKDTIIEGIGSQKSLFFRCYNTYPCHSYLQSHARLICYHYINYEYTPQGSYCGFNIGIPNNPEDDPYKIDQISGDILYINADDGPISVYGFDILGKSIFQETVDGYRYMDLSAQPAGVYLVYILFEGQVKPYKFVIQH